MENIINQDELKFLQLLAKQFPNVQAASTEIINLEAILLLPKGTEHFVTDIHGEFETFYHILSNASGSVKRKIEEIFKDKLSTAEKNQLATIIYYPHEKLEILEKEGVLNEKWYIATLNRLVCVARDVAMKYTRSKVRKAMPKNYEYIIDELLYESSIDKASYFSSIIKSIIELDRANFFIESICAFIKRLLIDRLHVVGDIYDRGPNAEKVMNLITNHHSVDIQWGNHDIVWMGAACGIDLNVAEVIRLSARHSNLETVEDEYGINLMPIISFALSQYENDPAIPFIPKSTQKGQLETDVRLVTLIHKAISVITFKLEGQLIKRNPNFNMRHRLVLDMINYEKGEICIDGETYPLIDSHFPTIDPSDPHRLTKEEEIVIEKIRQSFLNSEKLQKHIAFLFSKGGMYLVYNNNLLCHGCIPMTSETEFKKFNVKGKEVYGKELCDRFEDTVRKVWLDKENANNHPDRDYFWYLWCGDTSPIFGKDRMATFERYLIEDKKPHKENQNIYFKLRNNKDVASLILKEFGLDIKDSRIINGHVPVKVKKGESPILSDGRLLVIDGGMSRPYQKETGIGGYTLVYSSTRLFIAEHMPFSCKQEAIEKDEDIISSLLIVENKENPILVRDTDIGNELRSQIKDLKLLIKAFNKGLILEK